MKSKRSRPILKFDLEGRFISRYDRLSDVVRDGHKTASAHNVAMLRNFTHQDHIFIYENDYSDEELDKRVERVKNKYYMNFRRIGQYELDGTPVREWDSIIDTERKGHFNRQLVWAVLNGNNTQHAGYVWKYLDNK